MCFTHYTHDNVQTGWLALINCAASSPAICTQAQEKLLLLSSQQSTNTGELHLIW